MSAAMSGTHLFGDMNFARPMSQPNPLTIRPPDRSLLGDPPPTIGTVTGLGNGGATLFRGDGISGTLYLFPGVGAAATGSLALTFGPARAANAWFCAASFATLALTGGNPLIVTWTAPAPLMPNSKPHLLTYQLKQAFAA